MCGTYSVLSANGAILKRRLDQPIARLVEETLWRLPVYTTIIISYSNITQTSEFFQTIQIYVKGQSDKYHPCQSPLPFNDNIMIIIFKLLHDNGRQ